MYTSGWYQTMRSQAQIPWSPLLLTWPAWQIVLSLVAMGHHSQAFEGEELLDLQVLMPSLSLDKGSCTLIRACIHHVFNFFCDAAKRLLWAASNQRQFWVSKSTFRPFKCFFLHFSSSCFPYMQDNQHFCLSGGVCNGSKVSVHPGHKSRHSFALSREMMRR